MKKRILSSFIAVLTFAAMFALPTNAATKKQGYALYRDKASYLTYHAGLVDEDTGNKCIIHHPGTSGSYVSWISWDKFNVTQFRGHRKPKSGISSAGRDKVRNTAKNLVSKNIPYTIASQLEVSVSILNSSQRLIYTGDIKKMRCDGVVEYCYEWHGYRILGNNSYWDITLATWGNYGEHSPLPAITPYRQYWAMDAA